MKLHLFNPEHDLALATNEAHFTAPHAARELRADLGFIPALWASNGDLVLVDDVAAAFNAYRRFKFDRKPEVIFIAKDDLTTGIFSSDAHIEIAPWGWDRAIVMQLKNMQIPKHLLPSDDALQHIRRLSHRQTSVVLLHALREQLPQSTVGERVECRRMMEVHQWIDRWHHIVVKAPWSSSGRGVRYIHSEMETNTAGWLNNMITRQGSIFVEPYFNKVKDFGMEFFSDGNGRIDYWGLSLFKTINGAYAGSLLATEEEKETALTGYISKDVIQTVCTRIQNQMGSLLKGRYAGAFGVDMMVVAEKDGNGFVLHPCVEINLRRTMGHLALALSPKESGIPKLMRICYEGTSYRLRIMPAD